MHREVGWWLEVELRTWRGKGDRGEVRGTEEKLECGTAEREPLPPSFFLSPFLSLSPSLMLCSSVSNNSLVSPVNPPSFLFVNISE